MLPYNMTMGMISLIVVFGLAYAYAKMLGMKPLVNGVNALLIFLIVAAPATTYTLADGKSFTGMDTTALGSIGLFAAILIGIFTVKITHFFQKHNITIKMPDAVPPFLQDTFTTLIPLTVNVLFWYGLNTLVTKVFTVSLPLAISGLLAQPLKALTSVPGMAILILIATLLWSFGIHGTMIVFIAIMPAMMQYLTTNADLVAAGKPPVFAPVALFGALAACGGTGNTLPLVLMGLRSKSEQLKAVSKASLVPVIFNINEPVTFGFPIMYNPIMAIPFILTPLLTLFFMWIGYAIGFFKPGYVVLLTAMPIGVSEFLTSMAWQNLLIPVMAFVVGFILYRPFFKVYEKQLVAKEAAVSQMEKEAAASQMEIV
jgi:PTS system cellobiose-specific IIC component